MYALTLALTALLGLANASQMQSSAKFLNAPIGGRLAFTLVGTNFADCALGVDGSFWATRKDANGNLAKYNWATQTWVDDTSSHLVRIAVDGNGTPWGINAIGDVYYGGVNGGDWHYVSGMTGATDIGA